MILGDFHIKQLRLRAFKFTCGELSRKANTNFYKNILVILLYGISHRRKTTVTESENESSGAKREGRGMRSFTILSLEQNNTGMIKSRKM